MTITEFAILTFKSPPNSSDPILHPLFEKLSTWQSECSSFPLLFFKNPDNIYQVHLVTGWTSVAAHEAWIQGERNQELLRVFGPYVDMAKTRMVHIDVDFEAIPRDVGEMVIEQYGGEQVTTASAPSRSERVAWSFVGKDLGQGDGGDVFRFVRVDENGEYEDGSGPDPVERWVLKRVEL